VLPIYIQHSVVCRTRPSTQAKAYISRARVSSPVYSRPQLPINRKSFTDYTFSNEEIETIGRKHKALYESYHRRPDAKSSIDSVDDSAAYRDAWTGLQVALVPLGGKGVRPRPKGVMEGWVFFFVRA
jgi:hypothetical protein